MRSVSGTIDPPKINGWIRPKRRGQVRHRPFVKKLKLYCENSSLNGCKYFTEPGRHWLERTIWVFLYTMTICGAAYVVFDVYADYKRSPIITTEDNDPYPTSNVAFPALALCTLNRISYKSASSLAESIFRANISNSSSEEILGLLRYLGNLYDYDYVSFEKQHQALHNMLKVFYNGEYDPNEIMKNLTPKCHEVILGCTYRGKQRPCTNLFTFRKTQDGYCCTFNYVRQNDEFIPASEYNRTGYQSKVLQAIAPGVATGLTILIEPLLDDYYYTIPPGKGWKIIIFNAEDYPDNPSGGVIEQMISPSTETYLRLEAIVFFTPDEIISYPVQKRKCIFNTELQKLFTGYTYSDCIVNCRVDDIWETCNCLPFFFPKRDDRRTCDMTDLPCLNSNKSKWWVLFPHEVPDDETNLNSERYYGPMKYEAVTGIDCSECYPACNDVRYFVSNSVTSLPTEADFPNNITNNSNSSDRSIIHIYFGDDSVPRLKQDITYYWYELLSNIGGICGVFVGFSLISILELIFFLLVPVLPTKKESGNTIQDAALYWEELGSMRRWRQRAEKTADRYLQLNPDTILCDS
ncbi:sodium channel protein Nach isoform X1 [Neodiprion pinetum]|uniref:sodium channel protein Nach isoform X1 n=2 Tax=Neodiprion pinetum TaxID=441929 RepID=UPI001EDEFFC7|nr:sodium channel protein Nach-like isoform X1 [Neodiprion pinetum]